MQTKRILPLCLPLLLLAGMVSCYEPIYSEQPVYGKLKFTSEPSSSITLDRQSQIKTSSICTAGDSVTVFMQVQYPGDYITEADYFWRLYVGTDSMVTKTIKVIAPHKQNTPPMWTFKVPDEAGKYTVTFKARYDYSAQNEAGQIYGESSSYSDEINVK